jgi:hypothetical protein
MFHDPETAFGLMGLGLLCVAVTCVAGWPQEQLCCRHAHPRHTASAERTSTTATADQRKNVYCERRGRGSSPMEGRCSMSKAPNEAQGPQLLKAHTTAAAVTFGLAAPERPEAA